MTQAAKPQDPSTLIARAVWLRAQFDGLPSVAEAGTGAGSTWIERRTRRAQALDRLIGALRALPDRPVVVEPIMGSLARVRMLGIATSSTMGVDGALRNWLGRAEGVQR